MAMASSKSVAHANHSSRGAVDGPALNSPRSRRSSAGRGAPSPWLVRGNDSGPSSPSSSGTAFAVSSAAVAAVPAFSPSLSAVVQDQIFNSSVPSPSNVPLRAAESSSPSLTAYPNSLDNSMGEALPQSSENDAGCSNAAKKPAWSMPSNSAAEVGPVMGAFSWPALSESTKASPKSSSSDPVKAIPDGSVSASQESATPSVHRQVTNTVPNTNTNPTSNHVRPARQRSMKRGSGNSGNAISANGGFPHPQPPPHGLVTEGESNHSGQLVNTASEYSFNENTHGMGGQRGRFGSQTHSGNDHQHQRNAFRRGNEGPHPRVDGSFHHNHGGRRDMDRGNQDWNHPHRGFNIRDAHTQSRVVPRGFIRPPPHNSAPFIPPPMPVRSFGNHMLYHEVAPSVIYVPGPPVDSLSPVVSPTPIPSIPPPHAVFFPVHDSQLLSKIANQIEYYFSNENLIKDTYLRQNMDDRGWVSIELVAKFNKVRQLTDNIQLILDALQNSSVVELQVQGYKVRKRNDWMRWIMSPGQISPVSSPQSMRSYNQDMLATHLQSVGLEDNIMYGRRETHLGRSSSGELGNQGEPSGRAPPVQATVQAGGDVSTSTGN